MKTVEHDFVQLRTDDLAPFYNLSEDEQFTLIELAAIDAPIQVFIIDITRNIAIELCDLIPSIVSSNHYCLVSGDFSTESYFVQYQDYVWLKPGSEFSVLLKPAIRQRIVVIMLPKNTLISYLSVLPDDMSTFTLIPASKPFADHVRLIFSDHNDPFIRQLRQYNGITQLIHDYYKEAEDQLNLKLHDIIKIKEIEAFICHNLSKPLPPVSELAQQAGMSVTRFTERFKQVYGQPIYQYHLEKRLEYAKELLQTRAYSIWQLAYMVGFKYSAGFNKAFQKYTGQSPSAFIGKSM
ncbi:hypothetical protein GCM10028808_74470 [Spirosoma migulaei]